MIAPARLAAFDTLLQIDAGRIDLGGAMARARRTLDDERDRALALEMVNGTLRMRGAIDFQLASRLTRPLDKLDAAVLMVLRMSGYQLMYSSRLPAAAIINDAVDLTRRAGTTSAAGLVNSVLRKLARDRPSLVWPDRPSVVVTPDDRQRLVTALATIHSHPEWLVSRWVERYGVDAAERWLEFNNRPAAVCLAANGLRLTRAALAEELTSDGVETVPTARASLGLVVTSGQALATRAFREGRCLAQDEASQLIAELVSASPGARVLDLCASPGGKTVALAGRVRPGGRVVACDVRPHRLRVLASTLSRCMVSNTSVVRIPESGALPFREGGFDAVLIDAPCSGLGILRRDPDIRWRRTPADLPRLAAAQRRLLARAAPLVKAGGTLTYSTCSSEPEENDEVVSTFLSTHPGFVVARRHETLPFRDGLEAFFAAVLRSV